MRRIDVVANDHPLIQGLVTMIVVLVAQEYPPSPISALSYDHSIADKGGTYSPNPTLSSAYSHLMGSSTGAESSSAAQA